MLDKKWEGGGTKEIHNDLINTKEIKMKKIICSVIFICSSVSVYSYEHGELSDVPEYNGELSDRYKIIQPVYLNSILSPKAALSLGSHSMILINMQLHDHTKDTCGSFDSTENIGECLKQFLQQYTDYLCTNYKQIREFAKVKQSPLYNQRQFQTNMNTRANAYRQYLLANGETLQQLSRNLEHEDSQKYLEYAEIFEKEAKKTFSTRLNYVAGYNYTRDDVYLNCYETDNNETDSTKENTTEI